MSGQLNFEQRCSRPADGAPARSRQEDANQPDGSKADAPGRTSTCDLEPGMRVRETYLVAAKDLRTAKNGKPYLKLRLGDRSGTVDCMVWEGAQEIGAGFEGGDVVMVEGRVTEYQGRAQIDALTVTRAADGQINPRDFLPQTYRDLEELKGFLAFHIESVTDQDYRRLLDAVFDGELFDRFVEAPAAKQFHHAYLGGLLEHTVSVAGLCDHVCQQYTRVNRDLLITAALLHDIGKVEELTFSCTIDYSDAGKFLGHVVLGLTLVTERARALPGFPDEKLQHLLHCIASHHGELEWGSPKRPKTIEALIIHHVDNLDAKVKGFLEIVEGTRDAAWTDLRNLFRRPLHVPRASHQEEDFLPPAEGGDLP
ncbi:MAG: HD domain-containing protein [Thermoleophilia bacterium]